MSSLSSFPKLMLAGPCYKPVDIGKQHLKIPRALYPAPSNAGIQIQKTLVEALRPGQATRWHPYIEPVTFVQAADSSTYPTVDLQDEDIVNVFAQQIERICL